jgi:TP901 family phage tail tape measure protein
MIGGSVSKITVEIGGKLAGSLTRSLRTAQAEVSTFSRNVGRTFNDAALAGRNAFKGVVNNAMWQASAAAAVGIGAGLASSTRVAIQFERSMSSVAAKLQASAEETTKLGDLAKQLGATTKFTASQAADAMDFLAMAGFKTNDILQATPGILNLAAMSNMDLADAADITSNILGGMGLEVQKTGRLVDVLAKAAVSGNVDVRMMGESFKYAGPVMKQAGVSIEQAAAMMAVLGDSGIQASEAGTGLRGVILRLAAPPKEAADALKTLGVSTADAQGNLKPMPALLAEIGTALNKVEGTANKAALAEGLFGKLQIASGNVLLESARLGQLDERIRRVADSEGAATEMARKMQDNLAGALTRLGSAVEGFQLALAGPNSKVLQNLVDGLANVVGGATQFLNTFPEVGAVVVGVSAAFVGLVAIAPFVASFISVVSSLKLALTGLSLGATIAGWAGAIGPAVAGLVAFITGPIGLTIAAIVGIGTALVVAYQKFEWFRNGVNAIWRGIVQVFQGALTYIGGAWKVLVGILTGDAKLAKEGVAQAFSGLRQVFGSIVEGIKTVWSGFASFIGGLVQRVVGFFQQHGATILAVMFPIPAAILGAFGALPPGTQSIFNQVVAYIRSVPGMLVNVGRAIIDTIINGIKARASALVETVKSTFAEVRKLMPFSDAKEGPFKYLTSSGKAIITTLAHGVGDAAPRLSRAMEIAAGGAMAALAGPAAMPALALAGGPGMTAAGVPVRSTPVVPNYRSLDVPTPAPSAGRGGMGSMSMRPTVNVNVAGTSSTADDIAQQVMRVFQDMLGEAESSVRAFLND